MILPYIELDNLYGQIRFDKDIADPLNAVVELPACRFPLPFGRRRQDLYRKRHRR